MDKKKLFSFLLSSVACAVLDTSANAAVLVDQLSIAPNGIVIVSTNSDFTYPLQIADDFVLSTGQPTRITHVDWIGRTSADLFSAGGSVLRFSVRFFRLIDGALEIEPLADVDVTSTFAEFPTSNPDQSLYSADIQPLVVLPNDGIYYLSIVADTPDTTSNWWWFFLGGPTMSYNRFVDGEAWTERLLRSYSFRLYGEQLSDAGILLQQLHDSVIGEGPGKSLAVKVATAQAYFSVLDVQSACQVLASFVNEVNAQSDKHVSVDAASSLIDDAQAIIVAIGCD